MNAYAVLVPYYLVVVLQAGEHISLAQLQSVVRGLGEYPSKYRLYIWTLLLRIPRNYEAYNNLLKKVAYGNSRRALFVRERRVEPAKRSEERATHLAERPLLTLCHPGCASSQGIHSAYARLGETHPLRSRTALRLLQRFVEEELFQKGITV